MKTYYRFTRNKVFFQMLEYLFYKQKMSEKSILEIWNVICDKKKHA